MKNKKLLQELSKNMNFQNMDKLEKELSNDLSIKTNPKKNHF